MVLCMPFLLLFKQPVPVFCAMHYTCALFVTLLDSFLLKKVHVNKGIYSICYLSYWGFHLSVQSNQTSTNMILVFVLILLKTG